jgi:hypothetical protein
VELNRKMFMASKIYGEMALIGMAHMAEDGRDCKMGPARPPQCVSVRLSGWDVGPTRQWAPGRECTHWWAEQLRGNGPTSAGEFSGPKGKYFGPNRGCPFSFSFYFLFLFYFYSHLQNSDLNRVSNSNLIVTSRITT